MSDQELVPDEILGEFAGPDGELLVLVASRTGRSIAVRPGGIDGSTVARIWHPLSDERRVEVEDRWKVRGAEWIESVKAAALQAMDGILPRPSGRRHARPTTLEPSRFLGTFMGPGNTNRFYLMVSRTGRTVTARRGEEKGPILARAERPTTRRPGIVFVGMYRSNPPEWRREFSELFKSAIRAALEQKSVAPKSPGRAST